MHKHKNNTGNQIEINYSFPNLIRKLSFAIDRSWALQSSFNSNQGLSGSNSDFDKETDDMGCDDLQMKLSAQQTSGKTDDIIAHSATTTDEAIRDSFFQYKKQN
ncbi:hypothetical protein AVEN_146277-1 [Araneus ventricosus]|uniref:Uncharacterized protein n=1 Tax=Araneus ventricosus TaxID=182803 RepID=A0A4Y2U591_ARAVE|nr:hypothetical protein AVEN_73307-1 [Araneus ventricosus]GBO08179.1 hypothetical protein AVEN_146277-1 [Araneus ventricosus]